MIASPNQIDYFGAHLMIKPLPLQKGDTIGIAASASPFDRSELEKGIQTLKNLGFQVKFREDLFSQDRYLAGSDKRRADELMELILDPEVKAIFFARGGYGTVRLMSLLHESEVQSHPKIILGYSDLTTLLTYLYQKFSWIVFHGPVIAKGMGDSFGERGKNSLIRCLTDPSPLGEVHTSEMKYLKEGKAQGQLIGGCLSILLSHLKTPYELDTEGKILFLEDTHEAPYKIDRMLTQLKLAKKLDRVSGIVFGPFEKSGASPEEIEQVILDVLSDFEIPMVFGFPSGHLENMMTIPFGVKVELDHQKGSVCFLEGALEK